MGGNQFTLSKDFDQPVRRGAIERPSYSRWFKFVAGLDEVGRGPLAGPVVAAAVVLPRGFKHSDIKGSKMLRLSSGKDCYRRLESRLYAGGVGVVEVEEIDRINILQASFLAMIKGFRALWPVPDCLLIDGNRKIPAEFFQMNPVFQQLPFRKPLSRAISFVSQLPRPRFSLKSHVIL
jgi:ribonuclease HII